MYLASPAQATIEKDRDNFLKAETALNKGDKATWQRLQKQLKNYPLYADLLFKQAIQKIDHTSHKQAAENLLALANTPLEKTYRQSWLRRLASKRDWKHYIDAYQPKLGTRYQCHYAQALYATAQPEKALPVASKLWLVAKSQPKHCDPVFKAMKKAGQLTDALIWQRIELAIRKGKTGLVKYLKKSLPKHEQKLVQEWLNIRYKPERALSKKYTQSESPRRQQMLVYGVKRMALFDADKALQAWTGIRNTVLLGDGDIQEIERYLALRMTTQKLDGAVQQHHKINTPDKEILEWGVRAALREQDWLAVGNFIEQMGELDELSDRWKYWKARQASHSGDKIMADTIYHLLAPGRGYHNFLAADQLDTPYLFSHQPLQYDESDIAALKNNYNVRRAHELYLLDRIHEARREWYYLIKHYGDEDRQKLAYIQKQWGWHSQAILTIATADYYDDLSLRFPVVYKDEIENATSKNGLDTSWVIALMRQESAFQPDARSSAGARGLMQLMPKTGRYVARLLKQRRPKITDLYKPETNIKLGTHYLKKNLKRFNANKVLTTAAYNAGPHRVSKWLPEANNMDADIWTETIPYKETRNYVQRIMSYASIYDHKLGYNITRVSQRMPEINSNQKTASNP
jgi:soluble lytic murein transglycosylase